MQQKIHGTQKALKLLRRLPRVSLDNQFKYPIENKSPSNRHLRNRGTENKSAEQRQRVPPVGFEVEMKPFYRKFPREYYYKDHHLKRQYPHLTLLQLQTLIDTNRIDTTKPIDIVAICNTGLFRLDPQYREFGFQLSNEGADNFKHPVNIEVQWASEPAIAAIERCGGVITTSYYDMESVVAMADIRQFFAKGVPIPRRKLPPQDMVEYYHDPKSRGYLADPEKIAEERFILSQKYGYPFIDLKASPLINLMLKRKDPRQIFHGLQPGDFVNITDKTVLRPTDPDLIKYYSS